MKHCICCLFLFLAACSAILPASPTPTDTPSPTTTSSPSPTETTTPTTTPTDTPTSTPTVTPTPRLVIHAGNAGLVKLAFQTPHPDTRSLMFAPDSTWLLIGSGDRTRGNFLVSMWWPDEEEFVDLASASATVWDAAFSPDGRSAAYVVDNEEEGECRGYVLDVESKEPIASLTGTGSAYSLAFSPDGTRLALGGLGEYPNGVIWLYNTENWELLYEIPVLGQNVLDLVFSPDGNRLYSAGTDGKIRIWDSADGTLQKTFQKGKQAARIAISPEGSFLASTFCTSTDENGCTKGGVTVWGTDDGRALKTFDDVANSVAFSPDGALLATGGGSHDPALRFRYIATWNLVGEAAAVATSIAFSPDGRLLAAADHESVTIWTIS